MNRTEIITFSQIQTVAKLLKVRHLREVNDFCIFSFENEPELNYAALHQYRQLYYELVIDITDTCSFVIENEKIIPQKNTVTLIKPFQLQSAGNYNNLIPSEPSKGYIMYFTPGFLRDFKDLEQLSIFDKQKVSSFTFKNWEIAYFEGIAKEINAAYLDFDNNMSKRIIQNYLEIILLKLQQKDGCSFSLNYTSASMRLHFDFLDAVSKHFLRFTTVQDYARLLHVSAKHLSETIKQEGNINALAIINESRLNYAKTLLLQTEKSISEIAHEINFHDVNNFSTYFKKFTRQTPSQFRKTQR